MSTLTEQERDSLTECECGHFANEHSSHGCLATDYHEDWEPVGDDDKCSCTHSPAAINRHAIEAIIAARVAAAVAAERERWREALATCACGCDVADHWTVCSTYGCPCRRDRVRAEATTRAAALLAAEREGGEE